MAKHNTVLEKDSKLGFPHLLLIDASAGTGKTHTLTRRYVQFLLSRLMRGKHNEPANIMSITFTNNTAREMKQRILEWLKKLALDADGVERRQTEELVTMEPVKLSLNAAHALDGIFDNYSDFHVQTIDSFMSRILRSSADELGIPPENDITDSYDLLVDETVNALLSRVGQEIPFGAVDGFLDLLNRSTGAYVWNPSEDMKEQFETFLEQESRVLEDIRFPDQAAARKEKYEELRRLYGLVRARGYQDEDFYVSVKRALEQQDHGRFDFMEFIAGYRPGNAGIKRGADRILSTTEGRELVEAIGSVVSELADIYSLEQNAAYGSLYHYFKALLEDTKRKKRLIHFDDINKSLARHVRKEMIPDIYCRLGDVLYHFLLDEFQDTGSVQWHNMQILLDEAFAKGGTLFAVGDMKQAIYQFRKADYRIMRRMVDCIEGSERDQCPPPSVAGNMARKSLIENHRSGGVILDYVDEIFKDGLRKHVGSALLPEDRTGLTDFRHSVWEGKAGKGCVRTIVVPRSEERPEKRVLLDIVEDAARRHGLRDITVLTYSNWGVEEIVAWLTEARVNAASYSSLSIKKRKIIMEIISLLQFLDSPVDNLRFAEFVTGEIFGRAAGSVNAGLTAERIRDMLLEKSREAGSAYLYTWFRGHPDFQSAWDVFFQRLYQIVGYYPLYDLVVEIFKSFRILENFPDETGFLVRFLEAIVTLESRGMSDIRQFAELVAEEGSENILNIVLPEYLDAVKVMTFHKAKGLGFPVVINLFYEKNPSRKTMYFDGDGDNLLVRHITVKMPALNRQLERVCYESSLDERVQDLNLLYVALTRAESELYNIVVRGTDDDASGFKGDLPESAKSGKKRPGAAPASAADAPDRDSGPLDLFEECERGKKGRPSAGKTAAPPVEPTTAVIPERTVVEFAREEDKGWTVDRELEAAAGDLIHDILAGIEFFDEGAEKALPGMVARAIKVRGGPYEPSSIESTIRGFLGAPGIRDWFAGNPDREVRREFEIAGPDGSLYRLDRIVIDPDRIAVIDFKTGEKLAYYEGQLRKYRGLLKAVFPGKNIESYIAFVDSGRVEEVK